MNRLSEGENERLILYNFKFSKVLLKVVLFIVDGELLERVPEGYPPE